MKWDSATEQIAAHYQRTLGWDREQALQVAELAVDALRAQFGGSSVYIPQRNGVFRDRIIREFNGRNITALSKRYGVSAQTVRNYLKNDKK